MAEISMLLSSIALVAVILTTLILLMYQRSQYWTRRGVHSIGNIIYGELKNNLLLRESMGESLKKHYLKYKHLRYTGTFILGTPLLMVHDPILIKEIVTGDVSTFGGKGFSYDEKRDPLSAMLVFLEGKDWKFMRTKLSPAFSSGKVKYMFSTVLECITKLEVYLERERAGKECIVINSRDLMARLLTDVTLSVSLGIEANTVENPNAEFRKIGRMVFDPTFSMFLRMMVLSGLHTLVKIFNITFAPKEVNDFFINALNDAIQYREKNNVKRNDFLDLMIQLKNHGTFKEGVTMDEDSPDAHYMTTNQIAAQAFLFFFGGFETSSSTLAFTMFEIAKHPEVQSKIQKECDAIMKASGGKITYETIKSLDYTEMVVNESQRLHPGIPTLARKTLQDCTIPTTDVKLDKGTSIGVSLAGLHRDPDYFPDPDTFNPERFSSANKSSIPPYVFMPFGEGPRICIGMRFAMTNIKTTLFALLCKYNFELTEGTPTVMEYEPKAMIPCPRFPLNLKVTRRKDLTL